MTPEELRRLAEAATPGERYLNENDGAIRVDTGAPLGDREVGEVNFRSEDIAFTLAASPDRIIALLDQLAAVRAALGEACDLALEYAAYTRRDVLERRISQLRAAGHHEAKP